MEVARVSENDYDGCLVKNRRWPSGSRWSGRALVLAGDDIRLFATPLDGEFQVKMFLVTDCDDAIGTCVVTSEGDVSQQVIDYTPDVTDLYFLIIDTVEGCGTVHVEMGGVLATEAHSWSSVKSLF